MSPYPSNTETKGTKGTKAVHTELASAVFFLEWLVKVLLIKFRARYC